MKLIRKMSQFRRDFKGEYECEGCGYIRIDKGMNSYDDSNYHENVTPNEKCPKCGKSTIDLGINPEKVLTRYNRGEVV